MRACARAAAGALLWLAAACVAQQAAVAPGTASPAASHAATPALAEAPSREAGRRAYTSFCVRCHGINLAVSSSAFYDLRTFPKDDKPRFVESVMKGRRQMPAWEGTIKPEQVESIWLYVASVNGW